MRKLNDVVNLVAAVGVVIGLAFVTYELRQTNNIAYEDANSSISDKFLAFYELMADSEVRGVLIKSFEGEYELSREEALLLGVVLSTWVEIHYYGLILQQTGRTDEDFIGYLENAVPTYIDSKPGRAWWEGAKRNYPPILAAAVDRGLAKIEPDRRLNFLDRIRIGDVNQ